MKGNRKTASAERPLVIEEPQSRNTRRLEASVGDAERSVGRDRCVATELVHVGWLYLPLLSALVAATMVVVGSPLAIL